MYINFEQLKGVISPINVILLQACRQQKSESVEWLLEMYKEDVSDLIVMNLIGEIKGSKKDSMYSKLRTTKAGDQLLDKLQTYKASEQDFLMFEYISKKYLESEDTDRKVGSKTKVVEYISWFLKDTQFNHYQLYYLIFHFIDNQNYTKVLEYVFFNDNQYRYQKPQLKNSPLYIWYENHKEEIESIWRNSKQCDYE